MEDDDKIKLALLFAMMKENDMSHIHMEFSGSGDDGAVDGFTMVPAELLDEEMNLIHDSWSSIFDDATKNLPSLSDYSEAIEELLIKKTHSYNWWDNEGGYGYIIFDINTKKYKCNWSINHMSTIEENASGEIEL